MASRSSPSGKRPRRPGERTEKERRAPQGPAPARLGRGAAGQGGGHSGGPGGHSGSKPPGPAGAGGPARSHVGGATGGHAAGQAGGPADDAFHPAGHRGGPPAGRGAPAGAAFIYGRNPVREALRGRRRVHTIWLSPGSPGEDLEETLRTWVRDGGRAAPDIRHAPLIQLTALAGSPDHQSVVAAVDPYEYLEPETILRGFTLLVALDEVQDPHNLGAIIRTAEGAGAGVVIPRHRAAEVTAAVVKASAGATEHAAIAQVRNLADFLVAAKQAGFWVYGAAAEAALLYTRQDYRYRTCFVVGSEGHGLGQRVESLCDVMVGLPLEGKVDSLNVSVSTGILLYEAVRQRAAAAALGTGATQAAAAAAAPQPAAAAPAGEASALRAPAWEGPAPQSVAGGPGPGVEAS
jgi:23S rRNA (guanosine2251-2'-O)-methyltransferase